MIKYEYMYVCVRACVFVCIYLLENSTSIGNEAT